ncbi:MAG: hypothetical protein HS104_27065 [Polyangiaceae bacterium]|nr:hypothetical protein [Polyangiaceae bacterium]
MSASEKTVRFYVRPKATETKAIEDALIVWINEVRAGRGLPPLEEDDDTDGREDDGT